MKRKNPLPTQVFSSADLLGKTDTTITREAYCTLVIKHAQERLRQVVEDKYAPARRAVITHAIQRARNYRRYLRRYSYGPR